MKENEVLEIIKKNSTCESVYRPYGPDITIPCSEKDAVKITKHFLKTYNCIDCVEYDGEKISFHFSCAGSGSYDLKKRMLFYYKFKDDAVLYEKLRRKYENFKEK